MRPIRTNHKNVRMSVFSVLFLLHGWRQIFLAACVQINQLGADEDGLWGIIRPHTTFQIEIFQGTLQMIHSKCPTYPFFKIKSLCNSFQSAPNTCQFRYCPVQMRRCDGSPFFKEVDTSDLSCAMGYAAAEFLWYVFPSFDSRKQ